MRIADSCPFTHFDEIAALWERALGHVYPISKRALAYRLCGRPTANPGDGLVALHRRRVVGFGMLEIERTAWGRQDTGYILALVVDPEFQRQGVGTALLAALEERLRREGCTKVQVAGGASRFWSGVPDDLPAAVSFFRARGYDLAQAVYDLVLPLDNWVPSPRYQCALEREGITVAAAMARDAGRLLEFELRESAGWAPAMTTFFGAGDIGNVLMLRRADEIVGTLFTYTPSSRFRGANLVWERLLGTSMGGMAGVGIAKAWRGKGLGAAMCEAAASHVRNAGANCCLSDWTLAVDFYAKIGASVWRKFFRGGKTL